MGGNIKGVERPAEFIKRGADNEIHDLAFAVELVGSRGKRHRRRRISLLATDFCRFRVRDAALRGSPRGLRKGLQRVFVLSQQFECKPAPKKGVGARFETFQKLQRLMSPAGLQRGAEISLDVPRLAAGTTAFILRGA